MTISMASMASTTRADARRLKPEQTAATRYLCAAAYLDENFARAVLGEVLYQPHRAVAPSHGIGLGPVIRHSLAAQRYRLVRDAIVATLLVLGLATSLTVGVAVLLGVLSVWLVVRALRALTTRQPMAALVYVAAAIVVGPLLAMLLIFGPTLLASGPLGLIYLLSYWTGWLGRFALWAFLLLLIWATCLGYRLIVHRTIAVELTPENYDPQRAPKVNPRHEQRLAYLEDAQWGNVTVYSQEAGSRPFIGFGRVTQQWSLAASLRPAGSSEPQIYDAANGRSTGSTGRSNGASVIDFTVDQLYEAIRDGMVELNDTQLSPDDAVPQLSVKDRVFVAGRMPPNSPFLEHGRPRYRLSQAEIQQLQRVERGPVRHYQSVRMVAWSGEVEVTTFLYVSKRGRTLYVEFISTVVPGIWSGYHRVDTFDRLDAHAALTSAAKAVGDVVRSPLTLLALVSAAREAGRRRGGVNSQAHRINRQLMFDYGCHSSVRELATNFNDVLLLQGYDANERINVIERRLLKVLVTFMHDRHFDVSEIAGQATAVINNSTTITNSQTFTNSTLNSTSVAAGAGASAHAGPTASPAASPAPSRTP